MAAQSRIETDLHINGALSANTWYVGDESVGNDQVAGDAQIDSDKVVHRHRPHYSQVNAAAFAATVVLFHAIRAGVLYNVRAGSIVAATGNSTVTIDIRKNGTTMLTAPFVLDNANTAYVAEAGSLAGSAIAAGDTITAVITISAGTGTLPTGLFVTVELDEASQ